MSEIYHHGVKGQRWGVRRYQNEDGTLTPAGKRRAEKDAAKYERASRKLELKAQKMTLKERNTERKLLLKEQNTERKLLLREEQHAARIEAGKRRVGLAIAAIGGVALVAAASKLKDVGRSTTRITNNQGATIIRDNRKISTKIKNNNKNKFNSKTRINAETKVDAAIQALVNMGSASRGSGLPALAEKN